MVSQSVMPYAVAQGRRKTPLCACGGGADELKTSCVQPAIWGEREGDGQEERREKQDGRKGNTQTNSRTCAKQLGSESPTQPIMRSGVSKSCLIDAIRDIETTVGVAN